MFWIANTGFLFVNCQILGPRIKKIQKTPLFWNIFWSPNTGFLFVKRPNFGSKTGSRSLSKNHICEGILTKTGEMSFYLKQLRDTHESWFEVRYSFLTDDLGGPPPESMVLWPHLRAPWSVFDNFWFSEKFMIWSCFLKKKNIFLVSRHSRSGALKWKTRDFAMVFDQRDEVVGEALHLFWVGKNALWR